MTGRVFEFQPILSYGLPVVQQAKQPNRNQIRPGRRLFLTADGSRLVEQGDPAAASLYCSATKCVPRAEFERLTDGGSIDAATEK